LLVDQGQRGLLELSAREFSLGRHRCLLDNVQCT
jgi:hypothetical protein